MLAIAVEMTIITPRQSLRPSIDRFFCLPLGYQIILKNFAPRNLPSCLQGASAYKVSFVIT